MKTLKFDEFIALNEFGDLEGIIPFEFKFIKGKLGSNINYEFYPEFDNKKLETYNCNLQISEEVDDDDSFLGNREILRKNRREAKIKAIYELAFSSTKTGYSDKKLDLKFANRVLATIFEIIKFNDNKFANLCYSYSAEDTRQKYYMSAINKLAKTNNYTVEFFDNTQVIFFKNK